MTPLRSTLGRRLLAGGAGLVLSAGVFPFAPPEAQAIVFCAKKKNAKVVTVRGGETCKKNEAALPLPVVVGPAGPAGTDGVSPASEAIIALQKVGATDGANFDAARSAAPRVPLFAKGPFSVYGKCFRETATNMVQAAIYIETTLDGAIFDGAADLKAGGPADTDFLNTTTLEVDREVDFQTVPVDAATLDGDEEDFSAVAPDGTAIRGGLYLAAKQGTLALAGGAYGAGNVCLFGGHVLSQ
jgi:hypothetical protein